MRRWAWVFVLAFLFVAPLAAYADKASSAPSVTQTHADDARIPFKASNPADGAGAITRVIGGFIVVALLAVAAVYVMKRYFPSLYVQTTGDKRRIQVLETRRLTPKATLFLIDVEGTRILLAQSGEQTLKLHQAPSSTDAPQAGDSHVQS